MLFREIDVQQSKGAFILLLTLHLMMTILMIKMNTMNKEIDEIENFYCKLTMHLVIMIVLSFL